MKEFEDILEEISHNLEWCDDAYQSRCYRRSHDEITRLRAENDKLREVLNDVTKELDQFVNIFKGYQGMKMNNAQAALRAAAAALNGAVNE